MIPTVIVVIVVIVVIGMTAWLVYIKSPNNSPSPTAFTT